MRHYWKEGIRRLITPNDYCVANDKGETCGDIAGCILDDLFGFMTTIKKGGDTAGGARTRVSPIKMSPAMGLLSLQDNLTIDFLTRRKPQETAGELKGDIVNVELAINLYKAGFSVDVVKVGGEEKIDPAKRKSKGIEYEVDGNCRKERILLALKAFKNISDFSKQARVLTDFSPDIILLSIQDSYNHLIQKGLELISNSGIELNTKRLDEILGDLKKAGDKVFVGMLSGAFKNGDEIKGILKKQDITLTTPIQAIDTVCNEVNSKTFEGK
ncbi:MAG TPA: type I-B CRISPR-associated protein Cas7/Cst2/DevR [Candidatus Atribacteria bacterium]|nr:type I-B CRISPR-associated protein Cas7/Cst2/DevR [Candidatus Atribacteria bacterium]